MTWCASTTTVRRVQQEQQNPQKRMDQELGGRITKARKSAGLSQRQLAAELKELGFAIDPSAVTRIESGERPLKVAEARALATVLRTTVAKLIDEQSSPELEVERAHANLAMHDARRSLSQMLQHMAIIAKELRDDPRRMTLFNGEKDPPESADEYLAWVRGRMQDLTRDWEVALAATPEDAAMLRKIAASLMGHLVEVEPMYFDWSAHEEADFDG